MGSHIARIDVYDVPDLELNKISLSINSDIRLKSKHIHAHTYVLGVCRDVTKGC